MADTKPCQKCGAVKPLASYHRNGRDQHGKQRYVPTCMACCRCRDMGAAKRRAFELWDTGKVGLRPIAREIGVTYSTAVRWLRASGRNTGKRAHAGIGNKGHPEANATIGAAPCFAAVDAAILRARHEAGMVDGRVRLHAEATFQSSLGGNFL